MDVQFDLGTLIPGGAQPPVAKLENRKPLWTQKVRQQPQNVALEKAINQLGQLSAEAQSLKRPVTTFERFIDARDEQALYLLWDLKPVEVNGQQKDAEEVAANNSSTTDISAPSSRLLGYLKIVRDRCLYLVDEHGRRFIRSPICVLDFFVHDSVQHQGRGKVLFQEMLKSEQAEADKCAFDKPSAALLRFLSDHFNLDGPIWQPTSFVVFPKFFEGLQPEGGDKDEAKRPMTAIERNRKSINEHYNGTQPSAATAGHSPLFGQRDIAGEIIHGTGPVTARNAAGPETPQGRKVTRDYGHQRIW